MVTTPFTAEVGPVELQDRLVYCYPMRLAVPSPPLPSVEMHVENNVVCVRYKGEMVKVSRSYFSKLVGGGGGPQGGGTCCLAGGRGAERSPVRQAAGAGGTVWARLIWTPPPRFFSRSGCSTATAASMTRALSGSCRGSGVSSAGTRYGLSC